MQEAPRLTTPICFVLLVLLSVSVVVVEHNANLEFSQRAMRRDNKYTGTREAHASQHRPTTHPPLGVPRQ